MKVLTARERALFISLWILLLLTIGIWKFWPTDIPKEVTLEKPNIIISDELKPVLKSAIIGGLSPSQYEIKINLTPDFFRQFNDNQQPVRIGFELLKGKTQLGGGVSVLSPTQSIESTLSLSNPDLVSASDIRLYLAR